MLPICAAVIAETLRLFPILPQLSRCVVQPMEIVSQGKRIQLPVGTPIVASIVTGHRDPNLWDDPDRFRPERFLGDDVSIPACYAPFSAGGRNCLGRYFAQLETRLILATIAQRMYLELAPTYRHHPLFSITLRTKYGMLMNARALTAEEVNNWMSQPSTTEKQRIDKAKAIVPNTSPVFGSSAASNGSLLQTASKRATLSRRSSFLAPCSKSNYGTLTPWILRLVALVGYSEVSRRGAMLLFFAGDDETTKRQACNALWLYTLVYGMETFVALFLGWIPFHGVHMFHMYEHHLAGFGLGAALLVYIFRNWESWANLLLGLCHVPLSVGLLSQLCEMWSVLRTFVQNPNHRGYKIVQRFLGAVLVSAVSMSIMSAFCRYVTEHVRNVETICWSELAIVPISMYLACIVQPSYVLNHVRALQKLLYSHKVSED